jgi:hypothetical protein
MEFIAYANVAPWRFDPGYLLQLVELGTDAVILLTLTGLIYAILYQLLCNSSLRRLDPYWSRVPNWVIGSLKKRLVFNLAVNAAIKEGSVDET